jgi:hypothetical protein
MASSEELKKLFEEGKLGELLARKFKGKRGRTYPNKDLDFLVVFKSEQKTPTAEAIGKAVTKYYTSLGYEVEDGGIRDSKCFEAIISYDRSKSGACCVGLVITTRYPFNGKRASLRVSCNDLT